MRRQAAPAKFELTPALPTATADPDPVEVTPAQPRQPALAAGRDRLMDISSAPRPVDADIDTAAAKALADVFARRGQMPADGKLRGCIVVADVESTDTAGQQHSSTAVIQLGAIDPRLGRAMLHDVAAAADDEVRWGKD
jgi:hypothetical protein